MTMIDIEDVLTNCVRTIKAYGTHNMGFAVDECTEALSALRSGEVVVVPKELLRSDLIRLSMRGGVGLPFNGACKEADEIIAHLQRREEE
jgi:hypothetical protein